MILKGLSNKTIPELLAIQDKIKSKGKRNVGGFYLWDKETRKELNAVSWAIYYVQKNRGRK